MRTDDALNDIRARIQAGYPLLFLKTAEEARWEQELAELALEIERGLVTWTITRGLMPPLDSNEYRETPSAVQLLEQLGNYPEDHLFLVKDFHPYLADPLILRHVRDLLPE